MSIACRIEKIQRDFLWGGVGDEHKFHLVNWQQVCSPMAHGGLGICNMLLFNKALLGKWLWRYVNEIDYLWRRVVDCKYGSQRGGWCSNQTRDPYGVSLWKYIRAGWESFAKHITFKMGDGSRIKFWKDSWCGDQPLQTRFPELFRLACDPNATVDTHLRIHDGTHVWDIEFYRPFQDWELEMGVSFMELLYSLPIRRGTTDSMWWQPSTKGSLRYAPITLFWFSLRTLISLGKGCGIQKCHPGWPSSFGRQHWVGSLPLIIYGEEG